MSTRKRRRSSVSTVSDTETDGRGGRGALTPAARCLVRCRLRWAASLTSWCGTIVVGCGLLAIAGCSPRPDLMGNETRLLTQARVRNDARMPAEVVLYAVDRLALQRGGGSTGALSQPAVLQPGDTATLRVNVSGVAFTDPRSMPPAIRVRVRTLAASWEQPVTAWYEVIGRTPEVLVVRRSQGDVLEVAAEGVEVRPVPKELWLQF